MTTTLKFQAAAGTDPGLVHKVNQDSALALVRDEGSGKAVGLFVVADGMGGHQAGDVASQLAVETIKEELAWLLERSETEDTQPTMPNSGGNESVGENGKAQLQQRLELAIGRANQEITTYAREHPADAGNLGTTVTCVLAENDQAAIANVGDSRTYLLRNGDLRQITEDHSYVARLVREGQLQPEQVFQHPRRNVITRSLGYRPEVEVDSWMEHLQPGDRLLLCSDGLWEMLRDPLYLKQELEKATSPASTVSQLIDAANANGGADNIGIVVVHVTAG